MGILALYPYTVSGIWCVEVNGSETKPYCMYYGMNPTHHLFIREYSIHTEPYGVHVLKYVRSIAISYRRYELNFRCTNYTV